MTTSAVDGSTIRRSGQRKRAAVSSGPCSWMPCGLLRCDRPFDLGDRGVARLLLLDRPIAFGCDMTQTCDGAARAGRNETPDNDVFLETFERVDLSVDGGV